MADAAANFAYSTVSAAPSPALSGTSLVVAAGGGALFPAVPFNAVIWPINVLPLSTNAEIVRVTAISTDTLTITRTQESTSARAIESGDQIMAAITKKTLDDKLDASRVSDAAYDATTWNGSTDIPTKNAIRDKFESLPTGLEKLTENRTIYVNATTGNDETGDGSVSTPYATFQKSATVAAGLFIGDYVLTIDLTGDFSGEYVEIKNTTSAGPSQFVIEGDTATPTNVPVGGIYPSPGTTIKGVHYTGDSIMSSVGGLCSVLQCRASKIRAYYGASLQVGTNITLTGDSDSGVSAESGSFIEVSSAITVSGTPAYSSGFASASDCGIIKFAAQPTGSATGPRYALSARGLINTGGGGATWLPGNSGGTNTDTTGAYL